MFNSDEKQLLLHTSHISIQAGLQRNRPYAPDLSEYPVRLREHLASFVTLKINGQLRGCIGTTSPVSPLITSIADNAYAAAFRDPRFPSLTKNEYKHINISISILGPSKEIQFTSEQDIIAQLRPGIDGLIIEREGHKATFLPAVWESLQNAEDFLFHLKHKAGISMSSPPTRAWSYQAFSIEERF